MQAPSLSSSQFATGRWLGAHLDTTTTPAADSLSPRRRSGERVRERGFKRARQFDGTSPSPPALSPLVPRREREQETSAMVGVSRCAQTRTVYPLDLLRSR